MNRTEDALSVVRSTIRRNHIGTFTATLILSDGCGRIHAWGSTKELAYVAAERKLAAYLTVREGFRA